MRLLPFSSGILNIATIVVVPISTALLYRQFNTKTMSPKLAAIRTSNEEIISKLTGTPVAVFAGGTSGIGQGMAETFAKWRGGKAHIIIVGRNEAAAQDIFSRLPKPSSSLGEAEWSHEFVQCDATLMSNVHRASQEILAKHPKINFLAMSPGFFSSAGRTETSEGIDQKLAVHYYARWKFIDELVPALQAAKDEGEEARVVSVLAAGHGGRIDVNNLGLKKGFSIKAAANGATTYNDYMIEVRTHITFESPFLIASSFFQSFAERHPAITFAHSYPGFVLTNLMASARTSWMRTIAPTVTTLLKPFGVSIQE